MRHLILGIAVASMGACATPAQSFQYDNSRSVHADFDETWSRTIQVLASNNLPIKTLEKDSGIIVAENELVTAASMGEAASCPSSAFATPIGGVMNYNVFVKSSAPNLTTVTVNTAYRMTYRDMNGGAISQVCNSNGNVERKLLNAISGIKQSAGIPSSQTRETDVEAIISSVRQRN